MFSQLSVILFTGAPYAIIHEASQEISTPNTTHKEQVGRRSLLQPRLGRGQPRRNCNDGR